MSSWSRAAWRKITKKFCKVPDAVEEEAMRTYAKCTEIATALAAYVREMGYPAIAHHNGASEVQAIPIFYQVGFGELGRHGSLINEKYGASFRPGLSPRTCRWWKTSRASSACRTSA